MLSAGKLGKLASIPFLAFSPEKKSGEKAPAHGRVIPFLAQRSVSCLMLANCLAFMKENEK
jgi:hypothetical protein